MEKEQKQKIFRETFGTFYWTISIICIIAVFGFLGSIMYCIWGDASLGWKIGLTSLIVVILTNIIFAFVRDVAYKEMDKRFR